MIISKTITLVAAPELPFVGTRVTIRTSDTSLKFGIYSATKADESDAVTVDWGDGSEPLRVEGNISQLVHEYPTPGIYHVFVSDDITNLSIIPPAAIIRKNWRPYMNIIEKILSNGTRLSSLGVYAFNGGESLTEVYLPALRSFIVNSLDDSPAFTNCAALREIHLGAANEEAIKSCSGWAKSQTLGAPNAIVYFDL